MKLAAALLTRPVSGPTAQIASTMASTWAASRISQICQCTFPEPSAAIAAAGFERAGAASANMHGRALGMQSLGNLKAKARPASGYENRFSRHHIGAKYVRSETHTSSPQYHM